MQEKSKTCRKDHTEVNGCIFFAAVIHDGQVQKVMDNTNKVPRNSLIQKHEGCSVLSYNGPPLIHLIYFEVPQKHYKNNGK